MSDEFNPYYEWLGIPPKHQPAEVSHSPVVIAAVRQKLDAHEPEQRK